MNTKTLKGILLYSLILIGSALAVFALVAIIMFIFPNLRLFGYGMISKKQVKSNSTIISTSQISSNYDLVVSAQNFNVNISTSSNEQISYNLENKCFGASTIQECSVEENISNEVYSIYLVEPSGLVFYRDSYINIVVPETLTYNLTIKTNNGNINASNLKINDLNIETGNGNFTFSKNNSTSLEINKLNISTQTGNFNFKSHFNTVRINNGLTLNANKGDIYFKDLESDVNLIGKDVYFEANNVTAIENGFEANVSNLILNINHLNSSTANSQNSILTASCKIKIKELTGTTGIKSSNGNINITTINNKTIINSSDGNVYIKTAKDYIKVNSNYSDITIEGYEKSANIKSLSGKINANSTCTSFPEYYLTLITTSNGSINHKTAGVPFNIKADNNATIKVKAETFLKKPSLVYKIDAPNSSVTVTYPTYCYFNYLITGDLVDERHFTENGRTNEILLYPTDANKDPSEYPLLKIIANKVNMIS